MDREEGEMSDDATMLVDDEENALVYKAEKVGIVVEKLEKVDAAKLEERARRFGLNLTGARVITQNQIDELYKNFGIENSTVRHFRLDTIHLRGVDGLDTTDIFEYLEDYKPVSLEWLDDISCNIVCQDHITAALALLVHSRDIKNIHVIEKLQAQSDHHWREGMPHPKKDLILMRFATNGDKKASKRKHESKHRRTVNDYADANTKNPWGDLCMSWGVYDHQEFFTRRYPVENEERVSNDPDSMIRIKNKRLATRLGKRKHKHNQSEDSSSDCEWTQKSKTPRMRMHADDEETKQKKKQNSNKDNDDELYAPLSIEMVNTEINYIPRESTKISDKFKYHSKVNNAPPHKSSILSRLGSKVAPRDDSSDDNFSDDSAHNLMSRVQKAPDSKHHSSVWSRLEKKPHSQNDLRQILKSKGHKNSDDLRNMIQKSKKSNLRIEIDNNYAYD